MSVHLRMRCSIPSLLVIATVASMLPRIALAQASPSPEQLAAKLQQLNQAIDQAQMQIQESQRQLEELKQQMAALQQQMSASSAPAPSKDPDDPEANAGIVQAERSLEDMRERQAMQSSQLATLQQSKVESDSKYPVRLSGMILLNTFVNAEEVDAVTAPTLAIPGAGSTALTLRQSVLGLDARGPHLMEASSYADLRMDFAGYSAGSAPSGIYASSYGTNASFMRLRTAHAGLMWPRAEAYFSLDRPIISPENPTSITAVSEPALAWSGNLWSWNPQIGANLTLPARGTSHVVLQGALIDVADAPLTPQFYVSTSASGPSSAELSRWPGAEARVGWASSAEPDANRIGLGGYFAPHRYPSQRRFNSWAATLDFHFRLPGRLESSASFYRGLGLGGLGGGAFKDYAFRYYGTDYDFKALDDVGGWIELKERLSERLQFNAAYGTDQLFAAQLRPYAQSLTTVYQSLTRNQTFTANTIYSPSAYLLFSLEYRRINSSPVTGRTAASNVVGLSAGYKF